MLHLIRDLIKDTLLRDRKRRKYSPAPGRNQAHKLDSFALQALLYHCATTTAQVHFRVEYLTLFTQTVLFLILVHLVQLTNFKMVNYDRTPERRRKRMACTIRPFFRKSPTTPKENLKTAIVNRKKPKQNHFS